MSDSTNAGGPQDRTDETPQVLTVDEARVMAAVADRIFPRTDTPGALDLGAHVYVERALAGPYQAWLPMYQDGLRQIETLARERFGQGFCELAEAEQDAVLTALDEASGTGLGSRRDKSADSFFQVIRRHVLEGVFGEPKYGGNRDMIAWRMVGFGGQQFGYPDPYIDRVVDLPPVVEGFEEPYQP